MSNNRPLFAKMIENFQKVYGDGSLANVGNVIGGKVDLNIRMGMKTPSIGFTNGCAIRMSYALNYSGHKIIRSNSWATVSGADKNWYLYRVRDLIKYLNISLGKPDKTIQKPKAEDFANLQGIIIFDVDWADATGHASLWNGKDCSDHCYFEKATEASIWLLK